MSEQDEPMGTIWSQNIFGAATHQGLVELVVETPEGKHHRTVIAPDEAKHIAAQLMQVAIAAETEENFVRFMTLRVGMEFEQAIQMLAEFRLWRLTKEEGA